jgi:putative nucleotidyltransferase with HDIG domain
MKPTTVELAQGVDGLVTLPDVFVHINQLVESSNSSIDDIAEVINLDPGFAVRLLRVANSSFYGFSSSIDTVFKAVSVIGTSQIRNLALSTAVANSFAGLPNTLVSMENFWRHSLFCGLAARKLAKLAGGCDAEAVFTAGLLHDIGELLIFNRLPEQAKEALLLVLDSADVLPIHQAEQQTMGFDHAQVGGELARHWKLPPLLEECIDFHHEIQAAKRYPRETALVHIANIFALMAEIQTLEPADVAPIDAEAWAVTGLSQAEAIVAVVHETQLEITETEKLFFGKS